jgi:hypothetical protein
MKKLGTKTYWMDPGKIWWLAMESLGADQWRSRQNLANLQPCPAGHGRGTARGSLGARLLRSVVAGAPPEGAAGGAGRWPPRELVLWRSCVSGGATDGSGGWGGGPRWQWCTQMGRWWLETGSSPWRQPWRLGGRPGTSEEERRAGFIGGEWEREVMPSLLRVLRH